MQYFNDLIVIKDDGALTARGRLHTVPPGHRRSAGPVPRETVRFIAE